MRNRKDDSRKAQRLAHERGQRREAIVSIARGVFADQGYDQAMIDKIAHEAGYTKVTIYNYFESKEDLFIAVVSDAYRKLFETMDNHLKQDNVVFELRSMGDAYLNFFVKYPEEAILFESGRLGIAISKILKKEEAGEKLTESEKEFRQYMGEIEKLMTSVITETMKASGVQDKVEPFSVIMVLSTFAQTIRELVLRGKRSDRPEETTREYLSVFFNIIDQGLKHYEG
ncbi:MAG: TetR/AcrR family transcriptional regulator [Candidatus Thorarchaeota archaeon]